MDAYNVRNPYICLNIHRIALALAGIYAIAAHLNGIIYAFHLLFFAYSNGDKSHISKLKSRTVNKKVEY